MTEEKVKKKSFIKDIETFVNTTGLKIPFNYLSTSQVNTYLICPRSYYWRYVEGKREPTSPNLVTGIVGHKLLENLALMDNLEVSEEFLTREFNNLFNELLETVPSDQKTKEGMIEFNKSKDKFLPSLHLYCREVFPTMNIVGQEVQVNADMDIIHTDITDKNNVGISNIGKITFVGFVDFINKTKGKKDGPPIKGATFRELKDKVNGLDFQIGDYKSGAEKDHTYFMSDVQTPFYSYVTGINNIRVDYIAHSSIKYTVKGVPYKNSRPPMYNILTYNPNIHNMKDMLNQFSSAAIGIGNGSFPMCHQTMWKCNEKSCGHWDYCRGKHKDTVYIKKVGQRIKTGAIPPQPKGELK